MTARSPSTTSYTGTQAQNGAANAAKDQSKKSEEINNYEISRVTKTEVTEAGRVNRISVAVLVDGNYTKNDKGDIVYAARSKEDLELIGTLVRSAIGFDQKRGDQVEVVNLRFAESPAVIPAEAPKGLLGMFQFTKDDIMYFIELGVMLILGIIVVFMVVRPLLKRVLAADAAAAAEHAPLPALPETPPGARSAAADHQQRDGADDRCRAGPGPGPRPVRASRRRTRRPQSE